MRNAFQRSVAGIGVPVQQQALASAHPENRGRAAFYCALDYGRRLRVLVEKISPGGPKIGRGEKNCTLYSPTHSREIPLVAVADID